MRVVDITHEALRRLLHWFLSWIVFRPPMLPFIEPHPQPIKTYLPLDAQYAIIYFHGNAGLATIPPFFKRLQPSVAVYAPEYPGYGEHACRTPSEAGVYAAARAALRRAMRDEFQPRQIIFWGLSLGGGPASYLAAQPSPIATDEWAGLVLDSTFASILSFAAPGAWRATVPLGIDMFPNVHHIGLARCRTALIHSPDDEIAYMSWHLPANAAAAGGRGHVWTRGGAHNETPDDEQMQDVFNWIIKR